MVSRHAAPLALVLLTERLHVPAPGLGGGQPGACGEVLLNGRPVDTRRPQVLEPGDELVMRTPGGGGYGRPADRAREAVQRDLDQGYTIRTTDPPSRGKE